MDAHDYSRDFWHKQKIKRIVQLLISGKEKKMDLLGKFGSSPENTKPD
jgi:hypothetical protein